MDTELTAFAKFCGPGAFAAVVGCSREAAATTLCRIAEREGWPPHPTHTVPGVLAAALREAGYELEAWSVLPRGWRLGPVSCCTWVDVMAIADAVGRANEAAAVQINRAAARVLIERAGRIAAERRELRRISPLPVISWLIRLPRGTWVLHVDNHVMAARDGELIAGDDDGRFDLYPLRDAWRVVPATN
jgi:hypothetical protein